MAIAEGAMIPDVDLWIKTDDGVQKVNSREVLGQGRVVLFAVPGAFTPTCSDHHLPGFVMQADEILAKGVDRIACVSVNDAFVMNAWGNAQGTSGKVLMLADGNAEFATAAGLQLDGSGFGLGTRSQRYAAILRDGVVEKIFVEPDTGVSVSGADQILKAL